MHGWGMRSLCWETMGLFLLARYIFAGSVLLPSILLLGSYSSTSVANAFVHLPTSTPRLTTRQGIVAMRMRRGRSSDGGRSDDINAGYPIGTCTSTYSSRREAMQKTSSLLSALVLPLTQNPRPADAISFIGGGSEDKRQLELCLLTVLRVKYWAMSVANAIEDMMQKAPPAGPSDQNKAPYLEARLGCKALLTGRVGGGSNAKVYTLAGLQLKGCLKDAGYWISTQYARSGDKKQRNAALREFETASEAITESLAACVEFDGLETTLDPSPRSSLMLGSYTNQKAIFVKRMLVEQVVPSCDALVGCFDGETRERSLRYLRENYPNELPRPPTPPPLPPPMENKGESGPSSTS